MALHALHQFSNDAPDDPISRTAATQDKEDEALVQSWREYEALHQQAKAAKQSAKDAHGTAKEAEEQYARTCHTVWLRYKSQGKKNLGFSNQLTKLNIGKSRSTAYRVLHKYFPDDFPERKPRTDRRKPEPASSQGLTGETKSESPALPTADTEPPTNLEGLLSWAERSRQAALRAGLCVTSIPETGCVGSAVV